MKQIMILFLVFTLISCQKDNLIENEFQNINDQEIGIKNGRFYFPTLDEFQTIYNEIKVKEDNEIYNSLSNYYNDKFFVLKPIVTESNENIVNEQLRK